MGVSTKVNLGHVGQASDFCVGSANHVGVSNNCNVGTLVPVVDPVVAPVVVPVVAPTVVPVVAPTVVPVEVHVLEYPVSKKEPHLFSAEFQ